MFVVAHFLATDEVEVLPSNWVLSKDQAYWPPFKSPSAIIKAISKRIPAETDAWKLYKIRIMIACGKLFLLLDITSMLRYQ